MYVRVMQTAHDHFNEFRFKCLTQTNVWMKKVQCLKMCQILLMFFSFVSFSNLL